MTTCFSGFSCCRSMLNLLLWLFVKGLFFFLTSFLQWLVNHDWLYLIGEILLGTYLSWVLLTKKLNFSHRVLTGVPILLVGIDDSAFYWIASCSNSRLAIFPEIFVYIDFCIYWFCLLRWHSISAKNGTFMVTKTWYITTFVEQGDSIS